MKIILNKSKLVFNTTPTVAWELTGDYAKFENSASITSYKGIGQYTRLMQSDVVFNAIKFNLVKGETPMTVNYRVLITSYLKSGWVNDAPELYNYPGALYQDIAQGTFNIGEEKKDIILEVPKTTVPAGKEVVCLLYGDGANKLIVPTLDPTDASCNSIVRNNTDQMVGTGVWGASNTRYVNSTCPALTLLKKQ